MFGFTDNIIVLSVEDKLYNFEGKSYPCTFVNIAKGSRVISVRIANDFSDTEVLDDLREMTSSDVSRCLAYFTLSTVYNRKEGRSNWRLVISQLSFSE